MCIRDRAEGDGPIGGLLVTADSKGDVKGYAFNPEVMLPPNAQGKLDVGGALGVGVLSVIDVYKRQIRRWWSWGSPWEWG